MSERVNLNFRYQAEPFSQYEILFNYINGEKDILKKQLILSSLSSLWMPFAYSCFDMSEKELKQQALFAVYKLKLHIHLIENTFGLHSNDFVDISTEHIENGNGLSRVHNGNKISEDSEDFEQYLSVVGQTEDNEDDILEIYDFQDEDVNSLFKLKS